MRLIIYNLVTIIDFTLVAYHYIKQYSNLKKNCQQRFWILENLAILDMPLIKYVIWFLVQFGYKDSVTSRMQ